MARNSGIAAALSLGLALGLAPSASAYEYPFRDVPTQPTLCPGSQMSDMQGNCFEVGPSGSASAILMYLRRLEESGINVSNPDGAVSDAWTTCRLIQTGTDPATLILNLVRGTGLNQQLAARLAVQTVIFFCPSVDDGYFEQLQNFK